MQKRSWVRLLAAGSMVLLLGACGGAAGGSSAAGSSAAGSSKSALRAVAGPSQSSDVAPGQAASKAPADSTAPVPLPPVSEGSKVIRTGQVSIEVRSGRFDSTYSQLIALAGEEGGVVSESNASTDSDRIRSGTVTLSVPAGHFQAAIDRLRQIGTVQQLSISSQDVSRQYVDLQARLVNAENERDAMLNLLQRAQTVQEILAVQNQLGQYTQQVEQLKGQIDYLDHATSFSTIQVTIREAGVAAPRPPRDEWGIASAFWSGVHYFVQTLDGLIVILAVAGPYLLLAVLGWLLWRRRRRVAERTM